MQYHRTSRYYPERTFGCGCCWSGPVGSRPEIEESQVCMGKGKRKKPRPKKEKCPVNRVHEWYKEELPNPEWFSHRLDRWVPGEGTYVLWTCIHCWKEHKPPARKFRGGWRRHWSNAPSNRERLVLPKRPVQF